MRIAVCDLSTGGVDILHLDKDAEEIFNECDNAEEFICSMGYDPAYTQWMVITGRVIEHNVSMNNSNKPEIID